MLTPGNRTSVLSREWPVRIRQYRASGVEALNLMTTLCQRARLADPDSGTWEAADFQWWWRKPQKSDDADQVFWLDETGPVAGTRLSAWDDDTWQLDPIVVMGTNAPSLNHILNVSLHLLLMHAPTTITLPVRDDDQTLRALARDLGFAAGDGDSTAWMDAADVPTPTPLPEGFVLVDRAMRSHTPHPMVGRNGQQVARRLAMCSLYDPALDLAVETENGEVAGYSLYWFDPVTKVGLVEPVRVEDDFQRQGLAKAMVTEGVRRLVERGAMRVKVSYENRKARALYEGIGFTTTHSTTWFTRETR